MRKNIFLHFFNRDSREIFGLDRLYSGPAHSLLIKRALNISILLCEDYCIMPPGFAIEDELAFDLSEINSALLDGKLIRFPMRETNFGDYAEKKRHEYKPQRDRYSGLFNDRRVDFLSRHAVGKLPRASRIGDEIVSNWQQLPDRKGKLWTRTKQILQAPAIELVRSAPSRVAEDGAAVTWAEISSRLPPEAQTVHRELRNSLQNVYFRQYCKEFNLAILGELPFGHEDFGLLTEPTIYSFERFTEFLSTFSLSQLFQSCSAETLVQCKKGAGLTRFVDAYASVSRSAQSLTNLRLVADHARRQVNFDWPAFAGRNRALISEPDDLAIRELDDVLQEVSGKLADGIMPERETAQNTSHIASRTPRRKLMVKDSDIVLFVALDEELKILAKHFQLHRPSSGDVAASGDISGMGVDVISPLTMGRVPAAMYMTRYLERRKAKPPQLIMILGLAGGFNEEGSVPGHIICASSVVDLASRKLQDNDAGVTTRFRRKDYNSDNTLASLLRSSSFNEKSWIDISIDKAEWPDGLRPSLHFGNIASGDEVIASDTARRTLQGGSEKLLGVEMEAGGVCSAAEYYRVPWSMLRVVSDGADPVKADTAWRTRGMKTLAHLLDHIRFTDVVEAMRR